MLTRVERIRDTFTPRDQEGTNGASVNTLVGNSAGIIIGSPDAYAPKDCVVSNNIVQSDSGTLLDLVVADDLNAGHRCDDEQPARGPCTRHGCGLHRVSAETLCS